jgi:serine-type D-Ala-D-Ala carboxypeptidase/endopeptidase (penicillin-binding protein 4)
MKRLLLCLGCCWLVAGLPAQTVTAKLQTAFRQFEADSQLRYATSSLYVIDAATGQVVFDKNSRVGLAPASTQKIITAATAFELLGKDYRYKTELGYSGKIDKGVLQGDLIIKGYGDPCFRSSRYAQYGENFFNFYFLEKIRNYPIREIKGKVYVDQSAFEFQPVPNGWIWEDIGNYYAAGTWAFNWDENDYNLPLRPGKKPGDSVTIITQAPIQHASILNNLKTGEPGTGDNAYIHLPPYADVGSLEGTFATPERTVQSIRGAQPDAAQEFLEAVKIYFDYHKIKADPFSFTDYYSSMLYSDTLRYTFQSIYTNYSPPLDSIIYWFLQKSINLYGEALIKTFAYRYESFGSTTGGIKQVRDLWKQKGLDENELNISDGSGLSPQNRVTAHAQVEILKYARSQSWFPSFYNALPEYNGMKMKSGTIKDVKAFCGYHKAKDGKEYIFSFLVNNYNGSASALVKKIYTVLNVLK